MFVMACIEVNQTEQSKEEEREKTSTNKAMKQIIYSENKSRKSNNIHDKEQEKKTNEKDNRQTIVKLSQA